MKEAGCRLLIVGYESGDPQILKNIKKGATVEMALRFTENAKKLGLTIHGDFIVGLPGETRESLCGIPSTSPSGWMSRPIQVSIAHPYPGTEFYDYVKQNDLITLDSMTDETGHQLPNIIYPGLDRGELVDWVERFYGEYYFRPRVAWRIVRKAMFDSCRTPAPLQGSARIPGPALQAQEVRQAGEVGFACPRTEGRPVHERRRRRGSG